MDFLLDGPAKAKHSILLAHGAGAAMDSPAMNAISRSLADAGFRVARFEFEYMASRRTAAGCWDQRSARASQPTPVTTTM